VSEKIDLSKIKNRRLRGVMSVYLQGFEATEIMGRYGLSDGAYQKMITRGKSLLGLSSSYRRNKRTGKKRSAPNSLDADFLPHQWKFKLLSTPFIEWSNAR